MDEAFLCVLLMSSLPQAFDMLITNLESMDMNDLTLEKVAQKLQLEEQKIFAKKIEDAGESSTNGGPAGRDSTFAAYSRKGRRGKQNPKKDPCDNCGKRGHWKKDCWAPGGGVEGKNPKGRSVREVKNSVNVASHALFIAEAVTSDDRKSNSRTVDSGSTAHMTHDENLLAEFVRNRDPVRIAVAKTGAFVESIGTGTFLGNFKLSNGKVREVKFTDVLLVPDISKNLFSVSAICEKGGAVTFDKKGVRIRDSRGEGAFGSLKNGLFLVAPPVRQTTNLASKAPGDT